MFGLVGGWILAGRMLAPLTRITAATRTAAKGSLSHRIELEGRNDEFRELADAFDAMLARLEAHVAEQQRFAANASHELRTPLAITQTLLDVARSDPKRDNGELVDRLRFVNTRAIDLTEALLLLSRADQRSFAREHVDLSLIAEEATETLLPFAEERGVTIETSGDAAPTTGSPALLLQMATNLVHNAIVHNLAGGGHRVGHDQRSARARGAQRREHRREAQPAAGLHAGRAVPARQPAHPHRALRRRPRPGDRQEHHRSPRRDPHPHPPGRRRARRHGGAPRARMNLEALWHDLECGAYGEDLPLWRALAGEAGGAVLDVGAGTGRVTLDLAAGGAAVVALDADAALLRALEHRAAGMSVETVVADAREFALGRRFSLVLVPMQTLQLLGGPSGRAAFLRCALEHLEPGGLLAAALADALDCFDEEHDMAPPADAREFGGVRYASQLLAVEDEGGRAALHRRREIVGPEDRYEAEDIVVRLDRVSADEVAAEGREAGFLDEPRRFVPQTEQYLGSTVVVLRAP